MAPKVLRVVGAALLFVATDVAALPASNASDQEQLLREKLFTDPRGVLKRVKLLRRERTPYSIKPYLREAKLAWFEGEALRRLDRSAEALPLFLEALSQSNKTTAGQSFRGDVLLSLGAVYAEEAHPAKALAVGQQAFSTFVRIGELRGKIKSLIYLATIYDDAKDYRSAVKYLIQANEESFGSAELSLPVHNNLAGALKELGRYDEALASYKVALQLARRQGPLPEAQVLSGLARTALLRNDVSAADRYVREGLALAEVGEARILRPNLLAVLAQVQLKQGRPRGALGTLRPVFDGIDLTTTSLRTREAHEAAWLAFRAVGRPAQALPHLEALKRLDDEATKLATSNNTALMAARFDFANQELRIQTLKAEELRRNVAAERAQARVERLIFAGAAVVSLVVLALLAAALLAIRRSRNLVHAANQGLERTNEELGRALAARTEFLATTSHEIRTPLNGILGMTQVMLADPGVAGATRDRLDVVHAAGTTMRTLVDDILDVAKIESGRLVVDLAPFRLDDVLREVAALWEPAVRKKGVAFSCRIDLPDTAVLGDPGRVRQVLFNLLSNAAKFTDSGGVLLTAAWADDEARIEVADTGVGIAADKLEEVFESFRQADAGITRRFGGTGLGLSICRQLARAMGGDVTVSSRPGEGSRFTLTVPLPAVEAASEAQADQREAMPLLVVDANPISRAMLRSLMEDAGAGVIGLPDLAAATAFLDAAPAAGVLVDASALGKEPETRLADLCFPDVAVTLLWPAGRDVPTVLPGIELLLKPVSGPELIRRVLRGGDGDATKVRLVSEAA